MSLQAVRIKPNPRGKDRTRYGASQTQLASEWLDVQNTGNVALNLTGVKVLHIGYSQAHPQGVWDQVIQFSSGRLNVGEVVRIHAGRGNVSTLNAEDMAGAHHHVFTGNDQYVWNNNKPDCPLLTMSDAQHPLDRACYSAPVREGAVLSRNGGNLI